jgi:hypothetical protein
MILSSPQCWPADRDAARSWRWLPVRIGVPDADVLIAAQVATGCEGIRR